MNENISEYIVMAVSFEGLYLSDLLTGDDGLNIFLLPQ